jgi:thioredoxin-related protein
MLRFVFVLIWALSLSSMAENTPESTSLPKEEIKPTPFVLPTWFKSSFLDLPSEIKDATTNKKNVLIFAHQENCPFTAKFIETTFKDENIKEFILKHFEIIQLDVNSDREMVASNHQKLKEKEYARIIKIFSTPTLLFFNKEGIIVKRYSGYYPPEIFLTLLQSNITL